MRRPVALLGVILLCGAFVHSGSADVGQNGEASAVKTANEWLALVDQGDYSTSYDDAASLIQNALSKEEWRKALSTARGPLGELVSRSVKSRQYYTSLPGAPDGEYVVIQYETSFENKAYAIETVTPMVDKDGSWRVSGYYIR